MLTYWEAVKAAIYWAHKTDGCAYILDGGDTFFVVLGDESPTLHQHRVCLRIGV